MAGSPGAASMQLAASGRSQIAAAWAIASVARSLPGAITAAGASRSTAPASVRPQACGRVGREAVVDGDVGRR